MKRNTKIMLGVAGATALAAFLLMRSCGKMPGPGLTEVTRTEEPNTGAPFIYAVSERLNIPYTEYLVTAGKDTQLTFSSGTKITIPACAFSKKGNMLSNEKVTLKYREFHSKADLVAAGIPMHTTEISDDFLETTGMMELRAYQGEDTLTLSKGCGIKMELANTEAGNQVNLYQLDESQKSWIEKQKELPAKIYSSEPPTITTKVKVKKKVDSKIQKEALKAGYFKPVKPRVANAKKYSFHFKINLQQYPELNVYDGILWEYAGNGGSDDPGKNSWVQTAVWREMVLRPTGREEIYELTLSTREKTFTTIVRPVFEKEDMEYARDIFKDRYSKYRNYMDKKNAEETVWEVKEAKRKKTQKQVDLITRSFEINQFGIWNCDRYYNLTDPLIVTMNFSTATPDLLINRVYLVDKTVNTVIQVYPEKNVLKALKLKKDGQYDFLLLDSDAKFYKVSEKEFKELLTKGTDLNIQVPKEGVEMASVEELKKWM